MAAIRYVHNPMRRDLKEIKEQIASTDKTDRASVPTLGERFRFLSTVYRAHEEGEERFLFPAIDAKVPGASQVYVAAHRRIDGLRDTISGVFSGGEVVKLEALLSELDFVADAHLDQEENELFPLCDSHIAPPDQGVIFEKMAANVPQELAHDVLGWMIKLQSQDDREGFLMFQMKFSPRPVFQGVRSVAKEVLSKAEWTDLTKRIPELMS